MEKKVKGNIFSPFYYKREYVIMFCASIITLSFLILLISKINFIGATTDELGYLSTPAKLAGWNWNEAFKNYPFYGIGVSILWIPLFFIFNDFIIIYKVILLLNAILLIVSCWISFYCAKQLFPEINSSTLASACILLMIYPSNIFFVQTALVETILYFLFWLSFLAILKIIECDRWKWYLVLSIVQFFMIMVHFRTIVVALGTLLFLVVIDLKEKKKWVKIGFVAGTVVCGYLLVKFIQSVYIAINVMGDSSTLNTVNTNARISDAVLKIVNNFPAFLQAVWGQVFAFLVSGNILFFAAGVYVLKRCIFLLKNRIKKIDMIDGTSLYLLIIMASCFIAFASARAEGLDRVDTIVYTRYIENVIGPVLVLGIIVLGAQYQKLNETAKMIFVFLVLGGAQVAIRGMERANKNIFDTSSSVVVGSFFDYYVGNVDNAYTLLKIITVVFGIAFLLFAILGSERVKKNRKYLFLSVEIIMLLYWGFVGIETTSEQLKMKSENYNNYQEVLEFVKNNNVSNMIYWKSDPSGNALQRAKFLQILMNKEPLRILTDKNLGEDIDIIVNENTLILTDPGDVSLLESHDLLEENYKEIFSNRVFVGYMNCKN